MLRGHRAHRLPQKFEGKYEVCTSYVSAITWYVRVKEAYNYYNANLFLQLLLLSNSY